MQTATRVSFLPTQTRFTVKRATMESFSSTVIRQGPPTGVREQTSHSTWHKTFCPSEKWTRQKTQNSLKTASGSKVCKRAEPLWNMLLRSFVFIHRIGCHAARCITGSEVNAKVDEKGRPKPAVQRQVLEPFKQLQFDEWKQVCLESCQAPRCNVVLLGQDLFRRTDQEMGAFVGFWRTLRPCWRFLDSLWHQHPRR